MGDAPEREGPSQGGAAGSGAPSDTSVASKELRSAPRPLDRSIYWIPRKLQLAGRTVPTSTDLFLTARVLREVKEHLASGAGNEVGGLLAGDLFRCPDSGRIWVRVESAVPIPGPLPEQAGVQELEKSLKAVEKRAPEEGARWLGWYHSHALLGVFLSERDARFHQKRFPEPWQLALVVLADPERPGGGIFQPAQRGSVVRSLYLPFWELRDAEDGATDAPRATALNWQNYATQEQVVPERMTTRGETSRTTVGGPDGEGGPPGGRGPGRGRPGGVGGPWGMRLGPSPGDDYPLEVPLVLPGDDDTGFVGFWRRHRGRVGVLLLLCLLAGGGWLLWDRVTAPRMADEAAVVETEASPAAAQRPAAAEFQAALQSFEGAVDSYMERRADFDLGRLGCEGLTTGYRSVDEAFLRVSELFVGLRDGPGPRPTERYEDAAQRMEQVDRHFDASGCPRPS